MNDPRQIAASIVGVVDWQGEVSGFCRCPGEAMHTHRPVYNRNRTRHPTLSVKIKN